VIVLVAVARVGLIGMFIAQICAYALGVLAALLLARRQLGFAFAWHWLRKVYRYALPMVPAAFMTWWLAASNRFFLNTYAGLTEVGYYALAGKIAMAMQFIVQTFILAWEPFMLENLKNPDAPRIYAIMLKYYSLGMLAIGATLSVFARELFLIMAPASYLPGTALVAFLVVRHLLNGAGYITGVGVAAREMSYYFSVSLFCGVLANIASNLLLTPLYGIYGAVISEAVGVVVSTVVTSYISWRLMPVRWKLLPTALAVCGFILISIIANNLPSLAESLDPIWLGLIKLALLVVYSGAMALLVERKYLNLLFVEFPRRLARRIKWRLC
jgi:O-antigen/teichoic acid export membrane protein